jgi:hypothetical protein
MAASSLSRRFRSARERASAPGASGVATDTRVPQQGVAMAADVYAPARVHDPLEREGPG